MKEKFSLIVSEIDTALQKIDESQIEDLVQSILQADTVFLTRRFINCRFWQWVFHCACRNCQESEGIWGKSYSYRIQSAR